MQMQLNNDMFQLSRPLSGRSLDGIMYTHVVCSSEEIRPLLLPRSSLYALAITQQRQMFSSTWNMLLL